MRARPCQTVATLQGTGWAGRAGRVVHSRPSAAAPRFLLTCVDQRAPAVAGWKLAPALAAGCTIVLKVGSMVGCTMVDAGASGPSRLLPSHRLVGYVLCVAYLALGLDPSMLRCCAASHSPAVNYLPRAHSLVHCPTLTFNLLLLPRGAARQVSQHTPLTALRLGELALEAGVPPGVLNVLTGGPVLLLGSASAVWPPAGARLEDFCLC